MDPELFARVRDVLLAVQAVPASERPNLLQRLCGDDPELRREVEELLDPDHDRESPIARTGGGLAYVAPPSSVPPPSCSSSSLSDEELPQWIGRYRVLEVAGRGGMACVYRAEQSHPFHREVAIKLLHQRGGDEGRFLKRFEIERQSLALMDHPNIAKVFDAGEDTEGRPYLVMELIRGTPITEYCDRHRLPLPARVRLFRDICMAVEHAHRKGLIHRDLKPSNILVGDADGIPRVIDFGIAKAYEGDARADLTQEGLVVGTLEYMSPEQVSGNASRMDTRTDVYSLGVVLYLLATGKLPYDLADRPVWEIARVIALEDPIPPIKAAPAQGSIDSDLSAIVLKAIDKDPDRRYGSASALAEDLDRYLNGLPILAHPHSTAYEIKKLIYRNKLPSALAGSILLLLVLFGATMSVLFGAQRRERARAEAEATKAFRINAFLNGMLASVDPGEGRRDITVREVLDRAASDVDASLAGEPQVEAAVRRTIGKSYYELGLYDAAEPHLQEATQYWAEQAPGAASAEETIGSAIDLANNLMRQGRHPDAEKLLLETMARHSNESEEDDDLHASLRYALGMSQMGQGRLAEAEMSCRDGIDRLMRREGAIDSIQLAGFLGGLAAVLQQMQKYPEAETVVRETLALRRRILPADHPSLGFSLNGLGLVLKKQGKYAEADSFYAESLALRRRALGEDHPDLADCYLNIGMLRHAQGRFEEADSLVRLCYNLELRYFEAGHQTHQITLLRLAEVNLSLNRPLEVERFSRAAIETLRNAPVPRPARLASAWEFLGQGLVLQSRLSEAEVAFREGIAQARLVADRDRQSLASLLARLDQLLLQQGRHLEGETVLRERDTLRVRAEQP